jgi:hypothetical protein
VGEPDVDVVGPQPAQREVELVHQRAPRAVDDPVARRPADAGLRDDDDLVPVGPLEEVAEQLLGEAPGVAVGGVHERAARLGEGDQLVTGLVLVGVAPPGERAEAQTGDLEAGATQVALLHGPNAIDTPGSVTRRLAAEAQITPARGEGPVRPA